MTHATTPLTVHILSAHPVGEDSSVVWVAAARTQKEAEEKLLAQIAEGWDEVTKDELHDESQWAVVAVEETV
tara:strand:+ start:9828 stop:10043 length:216 start_codon:yes stop_codon:yes gene_type:complete